MKRILPFLALLLFIGTTSAQNPFEKFGYTPKIGTLSKGKYVEHFDNDSIVRIGSVLYNPFSKTIVGFVQTEKIHSEATLAPEIISRWLTPDPLAEEFPDTSPYVFTNNNPIRFVDPKGLAPFDVIINGDLAEKALEQLNASSSLTITRDSETGKLSATGTADTESDVALLEAINDNNVVVNLTATSSNLTENGEFFMIGGVFGGNTNIPEMNITFAEQRMNPNQAETIENFVELKKGSVVTHEILEAYAGAVLSPNAPSSVEQNISPEFTQAHNVSNVIAPNGDVTAKGMGAKLSQINRIYVGGGTWLSTVTATITMPGKSTTLFSQKHKEQEKQ